MADQTETAVSFSYQPDPRHPGEKTLHVALPVVDVAALASALTMALTEHEKLARRDRTGAVMNADECWRKVEEVRDVLAVIVGAAREVVDRLVAAAQQAQADDCDNPSCPVHHPSTAGVKLH